MPQWVSVSFWVNLSMAGMFVFLVLGLDLLFGSKMVTAVSRVANKKFQWDHLVVHGLEKLKKASDREFDVEHALLHGWGRLVLGGLLLFGAALILVNVLPRLK